MLISSGSFEFEVRHGMLYMSIGSRTLFIGKEWGLSWKHFDVWKEDGNNSLMLLLGYRVIWGPSESDSSDISQEPL
jgi:hypothetical protein